jgi:hypothetical protein
MYTKAPCLNYKWQRSAAQVRYFNTEQDLNMTAAGPERCYLKPWALRTCHNPQPHSHRSMMAASVSRPWHPKNVIWTTDWVQLSGPRSLLSAGDRESRISSQ